jgi:hypothetical protein
MLDIVKQKESSPKNGIFNLIFILFIQNAKQITIEISPTVITHCYVYNSRNNP